MARYTDANHPFFRPLWRRLVTLATCAAWFAFEIFYGDVQFMVLAGAFLAYGVYMLLIKYDGSQSEKPEQKE